MATGPGFLLMNRRAILWLYGELPKLVRAGVLDQAAAERLHAHYGDVRPISGMRFIVAGFAILGGLLIGAGIILLLAHNWEELSRPVRAALSFAPLVAGQLLVGYALWRKADSTAWCEGTAGFLAISIGASIALIGQTYNIPGNTANFLFTWLLLGIPLIYLVNSTTAAVLALAGAVSWAGAAQAQGDHALWFWLFAGLVAPYGWMVHRRDSAGYREQVLAWTACATLCIALGIVLEKNIPGLWTLVYSALFAIFYIAGRQGAGGGRVNAFQTVGALGAVVLALLFTYDWVWEDLGAGAFRRGNRYHDAGLVQDSILTGVTLGGAVVLLVMNQRWRDLRTLPFGALPLLTLVCFGARHVPLPVWVPMVVFNLYVLVLGVLVLVAGVRREHLALTNGGMGLIAVLAVLRFFDANLGFTVRGVLFILIGAGFLVANVVIARRRGRSGEEPG